MNTEIIGTVAGAVTGMPIRVKSRAIFAIQYERDEGLMGVPITGTLTVFFVRGGGKAVYEGVPIWEYAAFMNAGSKGSFYNANFKGR